MFECISKLISVLRDGGALSNRAVVDALSDFARRFDDLDYRSHMLGELRTHFKTLRKVIMKQAI